MVTAMAGTTLRRHPPPRIERHRAKDFPVEKKPPRRDLVIALRPCSEADGYVNRIGGGCEQEGTGGKGISCGGVVKRMLPIRRPGAGRGPSCDSKLGPGLRRADG